MRDRRIEFGERLGTQIGSFLLSQPVRGNVSQFPFHGHRDERFGAHNYGQFKPNSRRNGRRLLKGFLVNRSHERRYAVTPEPVARPSKRLSKRMPLNERFLKHLPACSGQAITNRHAHLLESELTIRCRTEALWATGYRKRQASPVYGS